ncbi:MAG: SNF2 helicase associated domain-containing protein [Kiritimatiellae bacterium]|nr:SNF2 helicase associated domain-containing protein [Kiritimatiellia bacterium]
MIKSGITQEELIKWGGAEVFNQALALCNSGVVKNVEYDDETLVVSGKIEQSDGWGMPVSFTLKAKGTIKSNCPCYANQKLSQVCPHVVAVGIALMVKEMEDDEAPQTDDLEDDNVIEVPMRPSFYAYISGRREALSIAVDAWYGEIEFPACSVQSDRTVYIKDSEDPYIRRVRSMEEERRAVDSLKEWGFEPGYRKGDLKFYTTDQHKILNFLGCGLPALRRRGWKLELAENLEALTDSMRSVLPFVNIKDAPNGDFEVNYVFDAQGKEVSPIEIQAALNRRDGYILKDGEVYLLDIKAIEIMHDVFRDCAASQGDASNGWFRVKSIHAPYVKSSLDALADVIETDDTEAAFWRENAVTKNRETGAKFDAVELGKLDSILRPYQKQGVYWMHFLEKSGMSGLLADEMGLGKTLQTLTWLSLGRTNESAEKLPSLIVCPTSLVRNWEAEANKFTPWKKTLVISGPNRSDDFNKIDFADIVITSYALLQRDFDVAWMSRRFAAVVLDEAQHIKNRQTKNAQAVKMLCSDKRLVLTGTPVENSVADVWSIFDFLMPGYLGEYESFKLDYEEPIAQGGQRADDALSRLKRKLHPFILRRVKKTVAKDLPDKIIKVSYCPMDEDTQREYNQVLSKTRHQAREMIKAKGFSKSKFEILAMLMKLRQVASLGKLGAFMEQLQSAIAGGHKILVFSQFVKMLQIIASQLQEENIPFCYLDGSTKDRLGECNRFNKDPKIPVFLISLMAGGTGLNLTGADMVIHYDPWWNPSIEAQATDRAHRIGQKKTVYVMKMIASGSIEERVLALQKKKEAIISATVATSDSAIMEKLSVEDLSSLLALG